MPCSPQTEPAVQFEGNRACIFMIISYHKGLFVLPVHVICAIVMVASGGLISARLDQCKGYQVKTTANSNSVAWGGCFYRVTPTSHSKTGINYQSSAEKNRANSSGSASCTEHLQYIRRRRTEKQWHNISRCLGNWHTRYELKSSSGDWIELCFVNAFQKFDLSSYFRVRHWIDTVDTLTLW